MSTILQVLSNPTIVSLVVGGVLAGWHLFTRSATNSSQTFAHALDAARSAAAGIVATIAPDASVGELADKVLGATNKLLAAAGINATSPLVSAAVNAVVHDAVSSFVSTKPPTASPALHAALVNLSQNPPAKAS